MRTKFLRALTAGALTLVTVAPAFALCNPGTPNCVTDGGPGSRLAKAKAQVFNPSLNCDTSPAQICTDFSRKAPKSKNVVVVAPARR